MHETTCQVQAEAEKPQDKKYRNDGPQHDFSPIDAIVSVKAW
jgi:hypothetical protein